MQGIMRSLVAVSLLAATICGCGGGGGGGDAAPTTDTTTPASTGNTAPVANAGPDQLAKKGDIVTLDGSASSDADNDPLTYAWSFASKPADSSAALSDPAAVGPTFTADKVGDYVLSLTVNDGTVDSAVDTVTIMTPKLPDTGQTGNFTTIFGEDSDYTINPPSYTDNGDGTVTDNVTGLMWQQQDDNTKRNWDNAGAYCNYLSLGGYNDWRLPTKREFMSIVYYGTRTPVYAPAIDANAFPGTKIFYWSATPNPVDTSKAWLFDFSYGMIGSKSKGLSYFVRCVRGSSSISANNFQDNNDSTVTDKSTGLMWQQTEEGAMTWESALNYCEGLSLAGHSDWRLPNIKELESLVDYSRDNPAIDKTVFPNARAASYWSATTVTDSSTSAWSVMFYYGTVISHYKKDSASAYVRCVR